MRAIAVVVFVLGLLATGCSVEITDHDAQTAAKQAEEFVRLCTVEDDAAAAYSMFSEEVQEQLSLPLFESQIAAINAGGGPTSVRATSWEPFPGEAALQIFLVGTDAPREFYYRLVMQGTRKTGYHPFAIFCGDAPYPESSLRQDLK